MARRPLKIGQYGSIRVKRISPKRWEARAYFRMGDGSLARPRRVGTGRDDAIGNLKDHMQTLVDEIHGSDISPDTRMAHVYTLWAKALDDKVAAGELQLSSATKYKGWVSNWVLPRVQHLTARELEQSVMTCQNVIKKTLEASSKSTASRVKVAFGLLCRFAIVHGAMKVNPVKATDTVGMDRKKIVALTLAQRRELLVKVEKFAEERQRRKDGRRIGDRARVWSDIPDRFRAKFATGVRVGEIVALTSEDVDTANRTVRIDHHLVVVEGKGVVRMSGRKGGVPDLLLKYPSWSHETWCRLKLRAGQGPLFPNATGGWISPDAASSQEAEALRGCGFGWVTGHVIRKTVATYLRKKGMSYEQIAAQLGNSVKVVREHYVEEVTNVEQAEALEGMFDDEGTG